MAPTATTWSAIRDSYLLLIRQLTPADRTDLPFAEVPDTIYGPGQFEDWAEENADQAVRVFGIYDSTADVTPLIDDEDSIMEQTSLVIKLAYSHQAAAYGPEGVVSMDTLITRDRHQLKRQLEQLSNFPTGLHNATVEANRTEGDGVTFLDLDVALTYYRSQTL